MDKEYHAFLFAQRSGQIPLPELVTVEYPTF
jgi:hypothetical protein